MTPDYHLQDALPKDAPALCRLRRKVWLATYPGLQEGITRELLLKLFDFTGEEVVNHYRDLIAGRASLADDSDVYLRNCGVEAPVIDESQPDVEKFRLAETGRGADRQLIAYASANRRSNVLTTIYVDPHWQGRGVGQALFEAVRVDLDAARPIYLRVVGGNHQAIAFYTRRGFAAVAEQPADAAEGRIFASLLMRRDP